MPFGSFMVQQRERRPKPEKLPKAPPEPKPAVEEPHIFSDMNVNSMKLNILLLSRTLPAAQEFLCSMSENMSRALHGDALTYYTTELCAISDVTDRKKRLERFFWEYSKKDWSLASAEDTAKTYTFSISPSGMQTKALELVLHCAAYDTQLPISPEKADAIWYLADGAVLDSTVAYDPFRAFLADALRNPPGTDSEKAVCLLLSQIESYGHFEESGGVCVLKPSVHRQLISRARELFARGGSVPVALLPVQIYGGLEYSGTDDSANPILRLSGNGYYQSYIPENCQAPAFYTIEKIAALREMDFFADAPCGGMKRVIHRHFVRKTGDAEWKADLLGEVGSL